MKILIVDDDFVSRAKLGALLAGYGACDAAENGTEALKLFEDAHKELTPYGLITMDIEMPDMSGQDVVNQVRKIERLLQVEESSAAKILMVTVKKELKEVSASYFQGCSGYLTKPTTPEGLAKALAEVGLSAR